MLYDWRRVNRANAGKAAMYSALTGSLIRIVTSVWMALILALPASAEVNLVMVEEEGCIWCARWNRDVSVEYPKTAEGRAAPLRRVQIRDIPDDLTLTSQPQFTPTFILVRDGVELSRLEGYAGEDFFWGLLDRMLTDAGIDLDQAAPATSGAAVPDEG